VRSISADGMATLLDEEREASRPLILVLSASDEPSLRAGFDRLRRHLLNPAVSVEVRDLAHTLAQRRSRLFHRGYAVVRSASLKAGDLIVGKVTGEELRVGFVFTGQGAQWPQMGSELVEEFPRAKALLQELDKTLQELPACYRPSWNLLGKWPVLWSESRCSESATKWLM
jgi:acyl transferase domain-containing protein